MIYYHYIYKLEHIKDGNVTLRADPLGSSLPLKPRDVLASLLTAWRMLYSGLAYRELPITRFEARQHYFAVPNMARMDLLYATHCYYNGYIPNVNDYAYASLSNWRFNGYDYKGGRVFVSVQTKQRVFTLMAIPLIYQDKKNTKMKPKRCFLT